MDTLVAGRNSPDDLVMQCEKLTSCATPPYKLNERPVRLPVQPQMGDDCGACVNHIAFHLATHGREFLANTRSIESDTGAMRVGQMKSIIEHVLHECAPVNVVTSAPNL